MIQWLIDWLRVKLGHWLLEQEEADADARLRERERRQKEVMDGDYSSEAAARDLDDGDF